MAAQEQFCGTGRRKASVARVYIRKAKESKKGAIHVNKLLLNKYFPRGTDVMIVNQPLHATDTLSDFDITVTVKGGGMSGQAGAVRLGIARALLEYDEELRPILREKGYITVDSRKVERKKYGRVGARKLKQFSKR